MHEMDIEKGGLNGVGSRAAGRPDLGALLDPVGGSGAVERERVDCDQAKEEGEVERFGRRGLHEKERGGIGEGFESERGGIVFQDERADASPSRPAQGTRLFGVASGRA